MNSNNHFCEEWPCFEKGQKYKCNGCKNYFCDFHSITHENSICENVNDKNVKLYKCGNKVHPYFDDELGFDVCYNCDGKVVM